MKAPTPLPKTTLLALCAAGLALPAGAQQDILRAYDLKHIVTPENAKPVKHSSTDHISKDKAPTSKIAVPTPTEFTTLADTFRRLKRPDAKKEKSTSQIDAIVALTRAFIAPRFDGEDLIQAAGTSGMVVRASQAHHNWIDSFLKRSARSREQMIFVEFKLHEMKQTQFEAIVAPVLRAHAATTKARMPRSKGNVALLAKGAKTDAFLKVLFDSKDTSTLLAPRVLMQQTAPVRIESLEKISYVKDINIEFAKDGSDTVIADPVVGVVNDGVLFEGSAALLPNGKIGLDFQLVSSQVKRPIRVMEHKFMGRAPVKIQLPDVNITRLETSLETDGSTIALFAMPRLGDLRSVAVLRVEALELSEADSKIDKLAPKELMPQRGEAKSKTRK